MDYEIIRLADRPEIMGQAAEWFHEKWNIPLEEYKKSMEACLTKENAVPQRYVAMEGEGIIGGLGVAGALVNYVCADMKKSGIDLCPQTNSGTFN